MRPHVLLHDGLFLCQKEECTYHASKGECDGNVLVPSNIGRGQAVQAHCCTSFNPLGWFLILLSIDESVVFLKTQ